MLRRLKPFGPAGHFYECPRWAADRWWASDMDGHIVYSFSADGDAQVELTLEGDRPGGLGWTPDGDLLVVSVHRKQVLRRPALGGAAQVHADLSDMFGDTKGFLNDMIVSRDGHAYVGFDADHALYDRSDARGMIVHVAPDGGASIVARGLYLPNGIVISPDGTTLVVAETQRPQLRAFEIKADRSLGESRIWAHLQPRRDARSVTSPPLGDAPPLLDGCDIDADGCVWVADMRSSCLRVAEGGDVLDAVFLPDGLIAAACALGGPDGKTMLICASDDDHSDRASRKSSQLFSIDLA